MFGLRVGYFNYFHDESITDADGTISQKSEFQKDRVILGSGVKFHFLKYYSLSIVADIDLSQKDESPLKGKFLGLEYNYDSDNEVYKYTTTENETGINFRLIPEIYIGGSKDEFIRIIFEANIIDIKRDFHFNPQSDLKDYEVYDDSAKKYIASFGVSFNHILSASTKAIYSVKYIGLIKGFTNVKYYPDKNNKNISTENKTEMNDNFIGIFTGFDIEITKYLFIRTGLSQGLYRYSKIKNIDENADTENKIIIQYFLPETTFFMGFYIQPITDFVIELNFSGNKDWNPENISTTEITEKTDGIETKKESKNNYDFNFGLSVSYKI